jgi:hypothetical protein
MPHAQPRLDRWPGLIPLGLALAALVGLFFVGVDVEVLIRVGALFIVGLGLAILVRLVLSDLTANRSRSFRVAGAIRGSSLVVVGAVVLVDVPSLLHSRTAGVLPLALGFSLSILQTIAETRVRRLPAA